MRSFFERSGGLKTGHQMKQGTDVVSLGISSTTTSTSREMERQIACVAPLKYVKFDFIVHLISNILIGILGKINECCPVRIYSKSFINKVHLPAINVLIFSYNPYNTKEG